MQRFQRSLLLWLCLASVCRARDIYVDNLSGDDRLDGGRPQTFVGTLGPVRTIAKALRLAEAGDRIRIAKTDEPYRESISLTASRHSGSATGPFVIEGNGATLDGSGLVPPRAWTCEGDDVYWFPPERLGYQQLFLDAQGRAAVRHPASAASPTWPPLAPLEWCLWSGKIYFRAEKGRSPSDYELGYCKLQTGITLFHVRDVVIENLTVQGFAVDGLSAHDGVGWAELRGLVCRANGRAGISVGGSSRVLIERCTLSDNGHSQLRCDGYSHTSVYNTRLVDSTATAIERLGGELTVAGRSGVVGQP